MAGQATYLIEESDAVAVMRRIFRRRMTTGFRTVLLAAIIVLVALLLLVNAKLGYSQVFPIAVVVGLPLIFLLADRVMIPAMARNHYRQSAALRDEQTVAWDEDGIRLESAHGNARFAWGEYHAFAETGSLLVLFQSEMLYNIVPLRALDEQQRDEIVALLENAEVTRD